MESKSKERRRSLSPISALRLKRLYIEPRPPTIAEVSVETGGLVSVRKISSAERGLLLLSPGDLALLEAALERIADRAKDSGSDGLGPGESAPAPLAARGRD